MSVKIVSVFTKKEDILEIMQKFAGYNFEDFELHPHFEFSVDEKLSNLKIISETFKKFELIKSVELRENEKKQRYYSINYVLPDETYIVISLSLNKEKPLIINAFHVQRSYKSFERSLRKNYGKKFI